MSTIEVNKNINNYFSVIDKKGWILKATLLFSLYIILSSIPGLEFRDENILDINRTYEISDHLWATNTFDYTVPIIGSLIICWAFYKDYNSKVYQVMAFYNKGIFNKLVVFKWTLYTGILLVAVIISGIISYREFLTNISFYFTLFIRIIPPLLYLNSLVLFLLIYFKNVNIGIVVSIVYFLIDKISNGQHTKILTLYGGSFYLNSPKLFYTNRILLLILSIIFTFLAFKRSRKI